MILSKKMTSEEFRNMEIPDDDTFIYELINGNIMRRSSPHSEHQMVQSNLIRLLGNFVVEKQLGRIMGAPMDVVFSYKDTVQPDVFFIKKDREKIIERRGPVWGSPDLIIEVISKGTGKIDRIDKFHLYEKFGVSEYWLVDFANQTIEIYILEEHQYVLHQFQEIEGLAKSKILDGFELDLTLVFD